MNWLPVVFGLMFAQDGPIPPKRVDPTPMPVPTSTEPVQPTDGREVDEQEQRTMPRLYQQQPQQEPQRTAARRPPAPASIFTDDEYRCARVRVLLFRALDGRV